MTTLIESHEGRCRPPLREEVRSRRCGVMELAPGCSGMNLDGAGNPGCLSNVGRRHTPPEPRKHSQKAGPEGFRVERFSGELTETFTVEAALGPGGGQLPAAPR